VVQGTVLLFALTILAINLLTDVLYLVIDPRIAR
jgi:ABC-type dipeptide/oligopeptide/nickel transport system permease component